MLQLLAQLQRLRSSACVLVSSNNSPAVRQYPDDSNSSSSSKGSAGDNSQHGSADVRGPDAAGLPPGESQQQVPAASHHIGSNTCRSFLVPAASLDIEGMACELLAQGYLVQVRDGAAASQQQQDRTKPCTRSCLQNLRHRFIVCLGWRSSADGEPVYLPEPLVLEPRLREQFSIAHPTAEYEALLQVRTAKQGIGLGRELGHVSQALGWACGRPRVAHLLQAAPSDDLLWLTFGGVCMNPGSNSVFWCGVPS